MQLKISINMAMWTPYVHGLYILYIVSPHQRVRTLAAGSNIL